MYQQRLQPTHSPPSQTKPQEQQRIKQYDNILPLPDIEPFLIEAFCKSFSNSTSEDDILSLLKPYFGKDNYTSFSKYITNCMIIPGQNKAIVQINDKSFGNFIFENYQVLNKDFPLIYKGNEVKFSKLELENGEIDYENDKIIDSDVSNSTKLTSSSSWNIDDNSTDEFDDETKKCLLNVYSNQNNNNNGNIGGINIDKLLDDIIMPSEHNIALYGWSPTNKMYGTEISLNLPQKVVNKILYESKLSNIPAQSFCLMVGFLTHNGPMSMNYYREQKKREQELLKQRELQKQRELELQKEREKEQSSKSITPPPMLQIINDNDTHTHASSHSHSQRTISVTSPTNSSYSHHSSQRQPTPRLIKKRNNNKMKLTKKLIENGFKTPVVMINNLNENKITCDKLFILCGVFGDVIRVKISYNKRDTAFVQLINHDQAKNVINSLNRIQLYGKMIYVNLSRIKKIKLPKDSPNSAMKFPDRKYLTKNYVNSKKHRYSKKNNKLLNNGMIPLPNNVLYVYNLPNIDVNIIKNKLINFLQGGNDKIKNINIINNEKAFIECYSLDYACQILIDNHLKLFYGNELKISFAKKYDNSYMNHHNNIILQSPRDKLIEKKFHMKKRQMKRGKNMHMNGNNSYNNNGKMYYQQFYRKKE